VVREHLREPVNELLVDERSCDVVAVAGATTIAIVVIVLLSLGKLAR